MPRAIQYDPATQTLAHLCDTLQADYAGMTEHGTWWTDRKTHSTCLLPLTDTIETLQDRLTAMRASFGVDLAS